MANIQKLKKVSEIGVFKDYTWDPSLGDFQDFNVIYGLNGSGKTTLSNILRSLEVRKCEEGNFNLTVDGNDLSSTTLSTAAVLPQVKVFNRDFISANVFTEFGTCCPIFFLGEDSALKRKQIEEKSAEVTRLGTVLTEAEAKETRRKKTLEELRSDTAAAIKDLLRSPGAGNPYNNYDKRDFISKCEVHKKAGTRPTGLGDAERTRLKTTAGGTAKPEIPEFSFQAPDLVRLKEMVHAIVSKSVVSEIIESLKSKPQVNTWVGEGLRLHKELKTKTCQFCESSLPDERLETLERHFSSEYTALVADIAAALATIAAYEQTLKELSSPDDARVYPDLVPAYRTAQENIDVAQQNGLTFLTACVDALHRKQANPFENISFADAAPVAINLESLNEQLRAHNQRTKNFEKEIQLARSLLEQTLIADKYERVLDLENQIAGQKAVAGSVRSEIEAHRAEILKLDSAIKEHRRPAQEINADLANYLGRTDITLGVEDAGYRIMRDGVPAKGLSEGEKTALAVIYFLTTLKDRSFDHAKGVVVIDDPVSSLDSSALFYAFSFIQQRTKDVGQLFITTHNFGFLRLVRKWFFRINQGRKKTKRSAVMYMLTCVGSRDGRYAVLAPLDPLLSEYESEYCYLFSQVIKGAAESPGDIQKFYHYPNIARRVLEAFLAFRLPASGHTWENNRFSSDMHSYLHELRWDPTKTNRILNFLNAHSHNARTDGTVDHDESILLETPAVLADVLALINHGDPAHCAGMRSLVCPPTTVAQS